ncbi:PTS transporter subunit EIIC [Enterococcus raffinosus]|uniref:PTS sugar transporter subunit IIC n=1 Tax=Enterococcus raffinosus TaxID=71452 RepID=UPI001C10556C|nr:PTS transporter subunit EIIC [Enterococcus raffinosus]MBU5362187.1 PTS transporter subunit EIIC [Enterococcus raffinosus]
MKAQEKFVNGLTKFAAIMNNNKYFSVLRSSFARLLPIILIGSFGTLFNTLISNPETGLAKWLPVLEKLTPAFAALSFATISFMTIPLVFLIGLYMGEANGVPKYPSAILALVSYIMVVPNIVEIIPENGEALSTGGLSTSVLGAEGLIIGLIIGILSIELFSALMKIEKLKIKMPDSVPPMIATSFNTLIPSFIVTLVFSVGGEIFHILTGQYINQFIYSVVQTPLQNVMQTNFGIVILVIISQLLWFVGMHGGQAISAIRNPIFVAGLAANIDAVANGMTPDQPLTFGFWRCFVAVGGAGYVLSLIVAIFIASKREDHKAIAKLGLLPAILGISEPVVFGLPLVMNVIFIIPFVLNSAISSLIAMFAMNIGFLTPNAVDVPFGIPILFNAFVSYGWQGVVIQAICLVVTILTWIPFVLISNKEKDTVTE